MIDDQSLYDAIGGHEAFAKLTHAFYAGVSGDPVLKSMYPEEDLGPAEDRLCLFLEQYFGGPTTYSDTRGHPRLRMRHMPYVIDIDARERWLKHMSNAVDSLNLAPLHHEMMMDYFTRAATAMLNA